MEGTIEESFLAYLKLAELDINKMSKIQLQEMRRAFFAGWGSMMVFMENESVKMDKEELKESISDFHQEIHTFWLTENANHNKN